MSQSSREQSERKQQRGSVAGADLGGTVVMKLPCSLYRSLWILLLLGAGSVLLLVRLQDLTDTVPQQTSAELEQPVREGTPLLSVYCVMERVLIIVHDG
ncbi:hypothetical protein L3Q82_007077 [Scortum barcoo]|uniref:Uncharacterized protein n=1 Tax=Scortum barcoo TaxID=214431 RepID=A0ACB8WRD4_9TELE|nr:hypothetical protein L3Q82_007077 [Scortum barcoo]